MELGQVEFNEDSIHYHYYVDEVLRWGEEHNTLVLLWTRDFSLKTKDRPLTILRSVKLTERM